MARKKLIQVPFPVKGVDQGSPSDNQPVATCPNALNARALHLGDRMGGGKRPGNIKAFAQQLGESSTRQINGLRFVPAVIGTYIPDWQNLGLGLNGPGHKFEVFSADTLLHVLGEFTLVDGEAATRFAIWDHTLLDWQTRPPASFTVASSVPLPSSMVVFGGALYAAGGRSATLGGVSVWDGSAWTNFGGWAVDGSEIVHSVAVYAGALYACGNFTTVGGAGVFEHIAMWNGAAWVPVSADDLNGGIGYALEVLGANLYVCGTFANAGGVANTGQLAQWTGAAWQSVHGLAGSPFDDGAGTPAPPDCLRTFGTRIYIGGPFQSLVGGPGTDSDHRAITSYVDGGAMTQLQKGLRAILSTGTSRVRSMELFDDGSGSALWVAGNFQRAPATAGGGLSCPNIAKWDGTAWHTVDQGFNGGAYHVLPVGTGLSKQLYATGDLTVRNQRAANGLARWNGQTWRPGGGAGLGAVVVGSTRSAMELASLVNDHVDRLYVAAPQGAGFQFGFGTQEVVARIAGWDGSRWTALGTGINADAYAIHDLNSRLYVTGDFTTAGGTAVNRIARWNGNAWETSMFSSGLNGAGYALQHITTIAGVGALANTMFIGGAFTTAAGGTANRVTAFVPDSGFTMLSHPAGADVGVNGDVYALSFTPEHVIIGGAFTAAAGGTVACNRLVGWKPPGATFGFDETFGGGMNGDVYALYWDETNDLLYVGGAFTVASGVARNRLARYSRNPTTGVMSLDTSLTDFPGNGAIRAIWLHDDGLGLGTRVFVGGEFNAPGDAILAWSLSGGWQTVDPTAFGGFRSSGTARVTSLHDMHGELWANGVIESAQGETGTYIMRGVPT